VIGGLITSTFLSLLVIPAVFTYVDDVGRWFGRQLRRLHRQPAAPAPEARTPGEEGPPPSAPSAPAKA
jgi:hypothetical protein